MSISFTPEQLEQIAQYPNKATAKAHNRLAHMAIEGRLPADPFAYFMGIVRNYKEGEDEPKFKTPKKQSELLPRKKAYERNDEEIRQMLKSTADCIRATAISMGYDIEHRTLRDIELMMAGIKLAPITHRALGKSIEEMSKEDVEYLRPVMPSITYGTTPPTALPLEDDSRTPTAIEVITPTRKQPDFPISKESTQSKMFDNNPAYKFSVPFMDESSPWEEILD